MAALAARISCRRKADQFREAGLLEPGEHALLAFLFRDARSADRAI